MNIGRRVFAQVLKEMEDLPAVPNSGVADYTIRLRCKGFPLISRTACPQPGGRLLCTAQSAASIVAVSVTPGR